jgi:hypothetical protein
VGIVEDHLELDRLFWGTFRCGPRSMWFRGRDLGCEPTDKIKTFASAENDGITLHHIAVAIFSVSLRRKMTFVITLM